MFGDFDPMVDYVKATEMWEHIEETVEAGSIIDDKLTKEYVIYQKGNCRLVAHNDDYKEVTLMVKGTF